MAGAAEFGKGINSRGEVKTSWLECMQENVTVAINNDLNEQDIALYKTGALWESPDGSSAVAIIGGRVAISDRKRGGRWYWTTVADGGKMIVNEVWTGVLYTELVKLLGEGGKLTIENNMITFADENAVRSRWGYDGDKYVFEMYGADGKKVLFLDDTGAAWFSGNLSSDANINVSTDVYVGQYLHIGSDGEGNYRDSGNIQFGGYASIQGKAATDTLTLSAVNEIQLNASRITQDGKIIATKDDITALKDWIRDNFAGKQTDGM